MTLALALLGVAAGALTTLAGQGGGLFLLLACSALVGPHAALAITAPALLLGNGHRAVLFRAALDRGVALRMIGGAVPGSFLGGLVAGVTPPAALHVLLVVVTALAIAKALGWVRFGVPRRALAPAGLLLGAMTGTAGGAGVLVAPILLSAGLRARPFIATTSAVAVATHAGRVVAYGWTGVLHRELLAATAVVTLAIFAGNVAGERVRARLSETTTTRLEYGVLVVCVTLAVLGVA
jgi:hypothetical protein